MTRRRFLQSTGSLAAAAAVFGRVPHRSLAATTDGSLPVSMAMHIHSSFSEGAASMAAQLLQAETNDVDVL
ncbi:MAG: twin-arginine translocation signal domain-containing protein, partial [Euzebyaceae bacterium]|nr:twin-arginine translocation signal domain-containing protein [Euzebyaceae bacterium]